MTAPFDVLTPDLAMEAVREAFALDLEGIWIPYPSYVNRVYGLRTTEGRDFVAKFYRPGRWTTEAIREEHSFLAELAEAEIPVASPLADSEGDTLPALVLETGDGRETRYPFALFPRRGGRGFDAETDEDWLRLGRLAGRVHAVGARRPAEHRATFRPGLLTEYLRELEREGLPHPECRAEFFEAAEEARSILDPLLANARLLRIHGDFHRGNILDRPGEGLLLMDFDDMAMGPAVQDLWLLLPGPSDECAREFALILEGYEEFRPFDPRESALIEPLRFLRMIHYLAWQARQRRDSGFLRHFPDWGSRAFWIKETEDLKDQLRRVDSGR
ncbi:MAG: serine/threonine protein kinase [Treponema sp.]|nr:serine/threonine protein kinase [Treponema sp.]